MSPSLQQRIDATFSRDKLMAYIFIFVLWLSVGAVYFGVRGLVGNGGVSLALILSAFLVVGYNTASLLAMVSHYSHDKNWIYEIDIRHLDEVRDSARAAQAASANT